jgi:hypothetical protein
MRYVIDILCGNRRCGEALESNAAQTAADVDDLLVLGKAAWR